MRVSLFERLLKIQKHSLTIRMNMCDRCHKKGSCTLVCGNSWCNVGCLVASGRIGVCAANFLFMLTCRLGNPGSQTGLVVKVAC